MRIEDTSAMVKFTVSYGRCMPHSAGGCGLAVGPIENEGVYLQWLGTGLCPTCQGDGSERHHNPYAET